MTENDQRSKFVTLLEGLRKQLQNEAAYFSSTADHQGEKGRLNEKHLERVLRQHLPDKYGIGTGFIVSSKTVHRTDHPQLDLIIYDRLNNAPLYYSDGFGIFPIEMVYAYMEVKTTLNATAIDKAFETNARVRALQHDKYYEGEGGNSLAPRFYIFAYGSEVTNALKLEQQVRDKFQVHGKAHCHGLYVLESNILLARQARYDKDIVDLKVETGSHTFGVFLTNLVSHCESMITQQGPLTNMTLPRASKKHYLSELSSVSDG
jgi:hypothetical protein